jgi:pimeloyl-ACP methyl ester carboxylesterase
MDATNPSLIAICTLVVACSADPETTTPPPIEIEAAPFVACPVEAEPTMTCATFRVPLDWNDPGSERIDFHVRKIPAAKTPSRGQLWMQPGGPGASGEAMISTAVALAERLPDLDLFLPDHRGSGKSTWIGCAGEEELAPACLAKIEARWAGKMQFFGPTAVAEDWGHVIEKTRDAGKPVYVYGVSYGSYFLNRYLQLHPGQAAAAILDSVVPGDELAARQFTDLDLYTNEIARRIFVACGADPLCSSKLGADPWQRLGDVLAKVQGGHCPELGVPVAQVKTVLTALVTQAATRGFAPAIVHRLERCAPADVTFLQELGGIFLQAGTPPKGDPSGGAFMAISISLSELFDPSFTEADGTALFAKTRVATGAGIAFAQLFAKYPASLRYPRDRSWGRYADVTIPLLFLGGGLDTQTPDDLLASAKAHFPKAHFVVVPRSGHAVLRTDPCGREIVASFLSDPSRAPDVSCVPAALGIDFGGDLAPFGGIAGAKDAWGD